MGWGSAPQHIHQNVNIAEAVACEHSSAAPVGKDEPRRFTATSVSTSKVWATTEETACKRTTLRQVTDKKSERRVLTQTVN